MTLLGKPTELIQALRKYRKQKVYEDMLCVQSPDSKLVTIIHGDVWSNNFFINQEETELTFIDFQNLCPSHPGKRLKSKEMQLYRFVLPFVRQCFFVMIVVGIVSIAEYCFIYKHAT